MITNKLICKYLIYLYEDYVAEYGDSLQNLDKSGELTIGYDFAEKYPEAIQKIEENTIKNLTPLLAKELEQRGFAKTDELSVYLTKEGIMEAKRLKSPVLSFIRSHWKWSIGTALAFIASIVAIVRLIKC